VSLPRTLGKAVELTVGLRVSSLQPSAPATRRDRPEQARGAAQAVDRRTARLPAGGRSVDEIVDRDRRPFHEAAATDLMNEIVESWDLVSDEIPTRGLDLLGALRARRAIAPDGPPPVDRRRRACGRRPVGGS
jgi:hypothetical protein